LASSPELLLLLLTLSIAALFAGTESALDTLRGALLNRALESSRNSEVTRTLLRRWHADPIRFGLFVRLSHVLAITLGAGIVGGLATKTAQEIGWAPELVGGMILATGIGFVLVEVLPRGIARHRTEHFMRLFPLAWVLLRALQIPLLPLVATRRAMVRFLGGEEKRPAVTEEDIEVLVKRGGRDGGLDKEQESLLAGVLAFNDTVVREVMVPLRDTVLFDVEMTLEAIVDVVREQGFSRYPVYEETSDRIIGVFHVKDTLAYLQGPRSSPFSLREFLRRPHFVPETKRIDELMRELQRKKMHIAVVVDEFGGTAGMATLEDIIEEVFGEIYDEHDAVDESEITRLGEGHYLLDGRIGLKDLEELLGFEFPSPADYDTLAGFVAEQLGEVPRKGDEFVHQTLHCSVREADSTRIHRVEVKLLPGDVENAAG